MCLVLLLQASAWVCFCELIVQTKTSSKPCGVPCWGLLRGPRAFWSAASLVQPPV